MFNRALLEKLTLEQLLELHRTVGDVYKSKRSRESQQKRWQLRPGMSVHFSNGRTGATTYAKVVEVKQTRAVVKCKDTGTNWIVAIANLHETPNTDKPAASATF